MKKVIASLCAFCTLISLCACGKSPAKDAAPIENKVEKSYSSDDLFSSSPAPVQYPLTTGGETLTMGMTVMGNGEDDTTYTNYALEQSEMITGVDIEVIVSSSSGGMEAMMGASGDYPDLIWQPSSYLLEYEGEDVLILNDLMAQYAPNYLTALADDKDAQKAVLSDTGAALQFYTLNESAKMRLSYGPVIRKDLLDGVGMDVPNTYSELYEVLTAIKTTYSPNLALRLYPTGATSADWLSSGYGVSLGSSSPNYGFYVVDGVVKYGPFEDGFEDYVTMLNKWYSEGLFNDAILDVLDISDSSYLMDQAIGKSAVFFVQYGGIETCTVMSEIDGFELVPIPDPVISEGDMTHLAESRTELVYSPAYAVSASCEYPELAVKWLDFWYSEEGRLLMNYGIEGESYELDASGQPQYFDIVRDAGRSSQYTLWNMVGVLSSSRVDSTYRQGYEEVNDVWTRNKDSAHMLPNNLMMETSMAEDLTIMLRDLNSAADEGLMKFIVGDSPLSEIESFRQKLNDMGAQRCIEYYQVFYDNYMNR